MMRATVDALNDAAERETFAKPLILAVTILTSHDQASLTELGIERSLPEQVVHLARLACAVGIDGVVASPQEIAPLRQAIDNPNFVILTPGVRPAGAALNDQKRVMTPSEAVTIGADYLVIGRPITSADDPAAAAQKICEEIEQAVA